MTGLKGDLGSARLVYRLLLLLNIAILLSIIILTLALFLVPFKDPLEYYACVIALVVFVSVYLYEVFWRTVRRMGR